MGVLQLLCESFAYMEGRIDPPSSLHRLSVPALSALCAQGHEIWGLGTAPERHTTWALEACVVLSPKPQALYLGKLAVRTEARGRGHARRLILHATERARHLGLSQLELQVRVELVENHRAFKRLGFEEVARSAHPGFDRPTSITMRRAV